MSAGRIAATASDSIPAPSKAQLDSLRQQALVDSLMSKDLGEVTVEAENTRPVRRLLHRHPIRV